MKGLITKELYIIKNSFVRQFGIVLIFAVVGAVADIEFFLLYIPMLLGIIPVTLMTIDETSRWSQYSLSMPVNRKKIVTSKFIITMLLALAANTVVTMAELVRMIYHKHFDSESMILIIIISALISLLFPSVMYPFLFRFGTAKGRTIFLLIIALFIGVMGAIFSSSDSISLTIKFHSYFTNVYVFSAAAIMLLVIVVSVSWFISVKQYEKREL